METFLVVTACIVILIFMAVKHGKDCRQMICTRCHELVKPRLQPRGSTSMELILWLFFIIPGVLYSAWRGKREKVCPSCGSGELVPPDSARGRAIAQNNIYF